MRRLAGYEDFRAAARRRLPRMLFDYIDGGSYAETTHALNASDLDRVRLRQWVMRDVETVDLATNLFGQRLGMPLILAPVGLAGMYARRGEAQAAAAAAAAGVPFCLSTVSICSIEEVAARSPVPPWFQLYMIKDRGFMREVLARAKAVGCPVLVLTVDLPTPGARYRDVRSGMTAQAGVRNLLDRAASGLLHPAWLHDVYVRGRPHTFGNVVASMPRMRRPEDFWGWVRGNFDPSVTWADLAFVREIWDGPIILKGILEVDDALSAAEIGVDGLVVSNHGGRQLDGVTSTITALPAIADAVGHRLDVLIDGGIRSGLDVLKALGLGAKACLAGRAWAYALACGGGAGVTRLLDMIREELRVAMILSGCLRVDDAAGVVRIGEPESLTDESKR